MRQRQKQTTVDRLSKAITQLEAEDHPVNTFTIKEVSGMDYMAYYRNREAFQLFQEHSTHLRKEREQAQAKQKIASRGSSLNGFLTMQIARKRRNKTTLTPSSLLEDRQATQEEFGTVLPAGRDSTGRTCLKHRNTWALASLSPGMLYCF